MSNKKISDLVLSGAITAGDLLQVVDVEDLSMSPTGTNKKITTQTLGDYLPVTATGSSASRSLRDRFSDTINVKDFGAVGDGIADDTAAIQAALASASSSEAVIIPNGVFKITSNVVANCPVVFDGVMSIVSPIVTFKLNAQPIVLDDYRKIYMGTDWNNQWSNSGVALLRAVEQLFGQNRYHSLDGCGRQILLDFEIKIKNFTPVYGLYKYITDMYVVLIGDGTFGTRDETTGVVTANLQSYAFNVESVAANPIYGIIFDKVRINCQKKGNGILFNFDADQESIIQHTNITNPYNMGIKSINTHLLINTCRITGGEFALPDDDRIVTGIEIGGADSEIINTTVQYCKTCVLVKTPTCLISNSHFFNDSTNNRAPVLHVDVDQADMRVTGCYLDNGPVWIENRAPEPNGYDTAGRSSFQNCVFTSSSAAYGNRSFIAVRPNQIEAIFRGILVSGCQFRDYRIFGRELNYTGNGSTVTFDCPLTDTSATYVDSFCDTVAGSNIVTTSGTYKLTQGLKVTGAGIASNTVINAILDDFRIQLNTNVGSTNTSIALTFAETLEVKVNNVRVYNWTLGSISEGGQSQRKQQITFSTPPANAATISLYSKYFAVVPFDVDSTNGTINPNDSWDMHIKDNAFYDRITSSTTDSEPVLRQSSAPMLKIETNATDLEYDVDWNYKTPFRLHVFDIESLGWRFANNTTNATPPVLSYQRISARSGKVRLSIAAEGVVLIKGSAAGLSDINLIN